MKRLKLARQHYNVARTYASAWTAFGIAWRLSGIEGDTMRLHGKANCSGGIACTTCPTQDECGRTGCGRLPEYQGRHPQENYVGWVRYVVSDDGTTTIEFCDSDAPKAFSVYRWADVSSAFPERAAFRHFLSAAAIYGKGDVRSRILNAFDEWHRLHDRHLHTDGVGASVPTQTGCEYCRSPLFAGRKCKNCGAMPGGVKEAGHQSGSPEVPIEGNPASQTPEIPQP